MADITLTMTFAVAKDGLEFVRSVSAQEADMSDVAMSGGTQDIPTTSTGTLVAIDATVTTPGWAWLENLDDTNFVEFGRQVGGTFYPTMKLLPGEKMAVRLGTANNELYARADTSTVRIGVFLFQE